MEDTIFGEPVASLLVIFAASALAYLGCLAIVTFRTRSTPIGLAKLFGVVLSLTIAMLLLLVTLGLAVSARGDLFGIELGIDFAIALWMEGFLFGVVPVVIGLVIGRKACSLLTLSGTRIEHSARRESNLVAVQTGILIAIAVVMSLSPESTFAISALPAAIWVLGTFRATSHTSRLLPCHMPESVCISDCASLKRGDVCPKGFGSGVPAPLT